MVDDSDSQHFTSMTTIFTVLFKSMTAIMSKKQYDRFVD